MKDIYLKRVATNDDIVTIREIFLSYSKDKGIPLA